MLWPNVETYRDGDLLDAATLNDPINQLIARTEYLKQVLEASDGRTNVAIVNATLSTAGGAVPALGQPVYRVPGGNAYAQAKAWADVSKSEWFWADHQAMAVGIVGSDPGAGTSATVVLSGYISFGAGIPVADVIADADPESGRYFLSATAGKLTAAPTGPIIYVCDCEIANGKVVSMLVNPQYRDTGESHIHRAFVLSGRPLGYAVQVGGTRYRVSDLVPSGYRAQSSTALPDNTVCVRPLGHWAYAGSVTYTLTFARKNASGTDPGDFKIDWTSGGADGSGSISIAWGDNNAKPVGSHGLKVSLSKRGTPALSDLVGQTWTLAMPDAGRVWLDLYDQDNNPVGFRLNCGMYPEMARFVPPLPANGAALVVDGVELRSPAFGSKKRWDILDADSTTGGPWLAWYGGEVAGVSYTAPFEWNATIASQGERAIVLHANRMRVGPTGFVTSLQPAPGSPLKVTSAQTGANAVQGALQVGLDIDFKSESGNAEGHEVVKRIVGSRFVTGPVVERVVAGPGVDVDRQQGTVTVSMSNAVYAGDFETIALKNAKQDLMGGVFPYTKLLGWTSGGPNTDSGFTAKFRVPDHIPYNAGKGYYVVVSASVFGEADAASAGTAAFKLTGSVLADQACAAGAPATGPAVASPSVGYTATIDVPFAVDYGAFDPVLVHGFGTSSDDAGPGALVLPDVPSSGSAQKQRIRRAALWLKADSAGTNPMVVYPGYFVGISIARCGTSGTPYTAPIGFLSLRWNLVAVQ